LQSGISFSERDFFKNPFSEQEIRELAQCASAKEIFSWRSPAVKKLDSNPGSTDDEGLIQLMLKEPRLIRRPLIRSGPKLIIGTSEYSYLEMMELRNT
jgi:arsenate reductase/regulatory protein spx